MGYRDSSWVLICSLATLLCPNFLLPTTYLLSNSIPGPRGSKNWTQNLYKKSPLGINCWECKERMSCFPLSYPSWKVNKEGEPLWSSDSQNKYKEACITGTGHNKIYQTPWRPLVCSMNCLKILPCSFPTQSCFLRQCKQDGSLGRECTSPSLLAWS